MISQVARSSLSPGVTLNLITLSETAGLDDGVASATNSAQVAAKATTNTIAIMRSRIARNGTLPMVMMVQLMQFTKRRNLIIFTILCQT